MLLGFWSRKFPEAERNYATFEKQLLAYYWTLIGMEQLTVDHIVILRPKCQSCNRCKVHTKPTGLGKPRSPA